MFEPGGVQCAVCSVLFSVLGVFAWDMNRDFKNWGFVSSRERALVFDVGPRRENWKKPCFVNDLRRR